MVFDPVSPGVDQPVPPLSVIPPGHGPGPFEACPLCLTPVVESTSELGRSWSCRCGRIVGCILNHGTLDLGLKPCLPVDCPRET